MTKYWYRQRLDFSGIMVNSDTAKHHTPFIFRPRPSKGSKHVLDFFALKLMAL
jgi:hypothetical protein